MIWRSPLPRRASGSSSVLAARGWGGACFAAAVLAFPAAAEEVFIGPRGLGPNFSTPGNWLDGSPPPTGDPTLALRFAGVNFGRATVTNDLADLQAQRLTLALPGLDALTVAGNALTFAGGAPELVLEELGSTTFTAPLVFAAGGAPLRISGTGVGALTLGAISESGAAHGLLIAATPGSPDVQIITLAGANSFTGGVTLRSGNLRLSTAPGGDLTVDGGTLRLGGVTLATGIKLNADLVIASPGDSTLSGVISSLVPGTGLTLRNSSSSLRLTGVSTFSGATTLNYSLTPSVAGFGAGQLILSGKGSALNSSSFEVQGGARLQIDASPGGTSNRLADTAPINLRNGTFTFHDPSANSTAKTEAVGTITSAGYSKIALTGSTATVQLNANALERSERGTFLLTGLPFVANGTRRLVVANPPASGMLPWAIAESTAGPTFVTAQGANILPLDPATFATRITPGATVRLTADDAISADTSINALILAGGAGVAPAAGSSPTLTVASGAVLASAGTNGIVVRLNFGAAEAQIFTVGNLNITRPITGSNGLTHSGPGGLTLSANNPFTGPLTINSGALSFSALAQLGAESSAITIHGGNLSYRGSAALDFARDLRLGSGVSALFANGPAAGTLRHTGTISGAGGLQLFAGTGGRIVLGNANTYTGPTRLLGGEVEIPGDGAFGASGAPVDFAAGSILRLAGPWETVRPLVISGESVIDTAGFDARAGGVLTGTTALTKRGAGTLTLTAASTFSATPASPSSGNLRIEEGVFALAGGGVIRPGSFSLAEGTKLTLDNRALAHSDRLRFLPDLEGAEFELIGHPTVPVNEQAGGVLAAGAGYGGTITLRSSGSAGTTLNTGQLNLPGPVSARIKPLLVRGDNLGGAGSGFTRFRFTSFGAHRFGTLITDDSPAGAGSSFGIYDTSSDADGVIGLRSLRLAEYATDPLVRNPTNGGTTPLEADVLVSSSTTASGAQNTVRSFTFAAGSSFTLAPGQTLALSSGAILARNGGGAALLDGGTFDLGGSGHIYAAGDFTIGSTTLRADSLTKSGLGRLVVNAGAVMSERVFVSDGTLRTDAAAAFAGSSVSVEKRGRFELTGASTSVGALLGMGRVDLGTGTLRLNAPPEGAEFAGIIAGAGALEIAADRGGMVTLSGANTFTGGVQLTSGVLGVVGPFALGTGPLISNGGALAATGFVSATVRNPLVLNADLEITGQASLTFAPPGPAQGAGGIIVRDAATLRAEGPLITQGAIRAGDGLAASGRIELAGPQGAAVTATGIDISPYGSLLLEDATGASTQPEGRLGDATALHLRGGLLELARNPNTSEALGPLTFSGYARGSYSSGSALLPSELTRTDRGALLITASTLGGAGLNRAQLRTTGTPPALVGDIFPDGIGLVGNTAGLLTYRDATGFELLPASSYAPSLGGANATSNVRLASATTNNASVSVNSLTLGAGASLDGTGAITVTSGALLLGGPLNNRLAFDGVEGRVFADGAQIIFGGPITGTNGLTLNGAATFRFAAGNALSGPLTLNRARVTLAGPESLSVGTGPIVIHGGGFELATSPFNVTRPLRVEDGPADFALTSSQRLEVSGEISGSGGIRFAGRLFPFGSPAGTIALTGVNTYTGATVVAGGTLEVRRDENLGAGGPLVLGAGGTLRLHGAWTSGRPVEVLPVDSPPFAAINTNGFNATLSGPLLSSGELRKLGAGALTLASALPFTGVISVEAGSLVIDGSIEGDVAVAGTGLLGGRGRIGGDVTVAGALAPGSGTGTLRMERLAFNLGGSLRIDLASLTDYDQLRVRTSVSFGSEAALTLSLAPGFDPVDFVDTFTVLLLESAQPIAGVSAARFTYAGAPLDEGSEFAVGTQGFRISYAGGDGNDVTLLAIPEPGSAVAFAASIAFLGCTHRRRTAAPRSPGC